MTDEQPLAWWIARLPRYRPAALQPGMLQVDDGAFVKLAEVLAACPPPAEALKESPPNFTEPDFIKAGCIACGEANDGGYETEEVGPFCSQCWHYLEAHFTSCPPPTEAREALEDMVYQFGYDCVKDGRPAIGTGGLSALEGAFSALGWDDPYVIPSPVWCDAPVEPRCPKRTTCGTPTPDGYKRYCPDHFHLWQAAAKSGVSPAPPAEPAP